MTQGLNGEECIFVKQPTANYFRSPVRIKQLKIGDFVDSHFRGGEEGTMRVRKTWTLSIRGLTCGPESHGPIKSRHAEVDPLQIVWRRVNSVLKHTLPDGETLLRLSTETGRSVVVSKSKRFLMFQEGRIVPISARNLGLGDMLMIPRSIPTLSEPSETHIRFKFRQGKHARQLINKRIAVNPDLMRFLGLFVSDGSYIGRRYIGTNFDFGAHETHLFDQVNVAAKNLFGVTPLRQIPKDKKVIRAVIMSRYVQAFLEDRLRVSRGAHNKCIPEVVWNVPSDYQRTFLQALWDGDAGATVSPHLASDMLYLMPMCLACSGSIHSHIETAKVHAIRGRFHLFRGGRVYNVGSPPIKRGAVPYKRQLGPPVLDVVKVFHELSPFGLLGGYKKRKGSQKDWMIHWQGSLRRHATEKVIMDYCMNEYRRLLYARLSVFWDSHELFRKYWKPRKELPQLWHIKRQSAAAYLHDNNAALSEFLEYRDKTPRAGHPLEWNKHLLRLSAKGVDILQRVALTIRACSSTRGVDFAQIKRIEEVTPPTKFVYDLEVASLGCFFAGFGGILVHREDSEAPIFSLG